MGPPSPLKYTTGNGSATVNVPENRPPGCNSDCLGYGDQAFEGLIQSTDDGGDQRTQNGRYNPPRGIVLAVQFGR